jgi:FtsP/CotA-like multicopper oxidase with cupredoxin domain
LFRAITERTRDVRCGVRYCRRPPRSRSADWVAGVGLGLMTLQPLFAAELVEPPLCSAVTATQPVLNGICSVTPLGNGHNDVKIELTAASAAIDAGGYKVVTENYNGNYLTPVIEAMPGDTVSARLVNALSPKQHQGMGHGAGNDNPTNLHYFHGGIVSPNNARPKAAETGDGDNVYVYLKSGVNAQGKPNSFDFKVPIPGEKMLDARVLETEGYIAHPLGLNWYHSHMHGISSDQVMGGMSGLLSVGDATANVRAGCLKDPNNPGNCLNDVGSDTRDLRSRTKVRYALLRDLPVKITKRPDQANGDVAQWDPDPGAREFPAGGRCEVWKLDNSGLDADPALRTGFCQRNKDSALLFTVNGQLFPTITVEGDRNLLIRLGNLSANIPYWLELRNEADGTVLPLTILSLDGVVPAVPVPPGQAEKPVQAVDYDNVLMMPATRAEIYVRNDEKPHAVRQVYVLRSKKHVVGTDEWPEVQLARIVLEANTVASKVSVALNAPVASLGAGPQAAQPLGRARVILPEGCVRDLDPAFREFRRVTFIPGGETSSGLQTEWSILTEIIRPTGSQLKDEGDYVPADAQETSVALGLEPGGTFRGYPFEEYVRADGLVDWTKRHVCIFIDDNAHAGSHKQLWVLFNATGTLHNFHIHQMKFRLATARELKDNYFIEPPSPARTCDPGGCPPDTPNYDLYDDQTLGDIDPGATRRWHDTIPIPPFGKVFVVMSFDAREQIGRFVFHCHILKHEDKGLMAPIEVWAATP